MRLPRMAGERSREGLRRCRPGSRLEQRVDRRRRSWQCVTQGSHGTTTVSIAGGKDDLRGFGVGIDVELGRRRRVAAAIDRAAHDGEPADAGDDRRDRAAAPAPDWSAGRSSGCRPARPPRRPRGSVGRQEADRVVDAGDRAVLAGRGAPPSPSSPWTFLASMIGCTSGRSAPLWTGMSAPATASVASMLSVAASRPTLPNTVVMASGARPWAISRSSAWASSTPPSVSRMSLLDATHATAFLVGFVDARPEVSHRSANSRCGCRRSRARTSRRSRTSCSPATQTWRDVAAAAGIDQQRLGIGRLGIARARDVDGDDVGGLADFEAADLVVEARAPWRPRSSPCGRSSRLEIGCALPSRCEATSPATRISATMS